MADDKLYGGSLADFADSMAEEMEKALNEVRTEAGMESLPPGDRDRQMLFLAIARGVVSHLKKKEEAFHVRMEDGGHSHLMGAPGEHLHVGHPLIQVKQP